MLFGPKHDGYRVGYVRGQPVPELAGRQRQPGEAELLLVPRPPRWTTPGRTSTRAWSASTRSTTRRTTWTPATRPRACACPVSAPNHADGSFDVDYDIPLAHLRRPARRRRHRSTRTSTTRMGEFPAAGNPRDAPRVVGQDVLQALPEPRLRRRHLHRQRHRVPGAGGEAAQVPLPLPGRIDRPDLRVQADDLDQRPEDGPRPRLHRRCRAAGSVADRGRPAGHEAGPRSPTTAGCCRSRSPGTRSSCGRPSGASTSSTSPSTRTARPPRRATSST